MLRSKSKEDIERHAEEILYKAKNEPERKSRCFYIAQLFYDIKEFDKAVSYLKEYLTIKSNSWPAYKLLGQAYENLDQYENALSAYENSLKYDETQHELLLRLCEFYCDSKINLDRAKAKQVLDMTQMYYPFHSVVNSLRDRIVNEGESLNKEEYEKMLAVEIKAKPNDVKLRILLIKFYLEGGRIEVAYRYKNTVENLKLFRDEYDWYVCCDTIYDSYYKQYESKCDTDFYSSWLQCVDQMCTLSYSVDKGCKDYLAAVLKLDHLLSDCASKRMSDEYKQILDHFSAQLSFHLAIILILKTKEKAEYSSQIQKVQIWFENKAKIGALLLISVRDGIIKSSPVYFTKDSKLKSFEKRMDQSKARYVQVYYTLNSLSKNSNQGEKQFIDSINFYVSGDWKKEIYKIFDSVPNVNTSKSHFMNSTYYKDVPQKLPSDNELQSYFINFERTYRGGLQHMMWLGLCSLTNSEDTQKVKIDSRLRLTVFKSLSLTSSNLINTSVHQLNQLDMDSFLYLSILSKALEIKIKGSDQPVIIPSSVTCKLYSDKQIRFWNNAFSLAHDRSVGRDSNWSKELISSDLSEGDRFSMELILEQVRALNLQLPLILHLARTFTRRSESEPPIVRDACEKRALYLWDLVLLNLKSADKKTVKNVKDPLFVYDVSKFTSSEIKSLNEEGRLFIGTYNFKCGNYKKALEILRLVQTPQSLLQQAEIYEAMSSKNLVEDSSDKRSYHSDNARDCLTRAFELVDRNHPLAPQIQEKLRAWNADEPPDNNYVSEGSRNDSDMEETTTVHAYNSGIVNNGGLRESSAQRQSSPSDHHVWSSTPQKHHHSSSMHHEETRGLGRASEINDLLMPYRNQLKLQSLHESLKLLTERIENYQSTSNNRLDGLVERLDRRFDKLETNLKTYFTDLKKEVKQKPDLYNMLEDDDYTPDADVLNYSSNYFQRNPGLIQPAAFPSPVVPGAAAPVVPPAAAAAAAYFNPNQLYQGGVPFHTPQAVPFADPLIADYLRTLAASQRTNALAGLPPLHQPTLVPTPNLSHVQVPSTSSPTTSNKQSVQAQAPNNVVITTSDSLPTTVPTTTPTLFVNIPPEHRLGTTPVTSTTSTAPHKFQIPMPTDFKSVEKAPVADPAEDKDLEVTVDVSKDSDGTPLEYDPLPNFKPVIPLPDEVEVKTGEEDHTVVFDCHAKLYRFVEKEWKERGVGQMKILKTSGDKPRYRILMRREQVHKVCANHFISSDMKLVKYVTNNKSYLWWALDYSDEKVQEEKLLVKFKTVEDGELFKEKFDEGRKAAEDFDNSKSKQSVSKGSILTPPKLVVDKNPQPQDSGKDKITMGGFTFSSQPKVTEVAPDVSQQKKQEDKKPSPFAFFNFTTSKQTEAKPWFSTPESAQPVREEIKCEGNSSKLMELLKPEVGSWECSMCYTRNPPGSKSCASCESPCPGAQSKQPETKPEPKKETLPSLSSMFKPAQGSWDCDVCLIQNKGDVTSCIACGAVKPGCTPSQQKTVETTPFSFSFGIPPTDTVTPVSKPSQSVFGQNSTPEETKNPGLGFAPASSGSIFTFGVPTTTSATFNNSTFARSKFTFTMATPTKNDDNKSPHVTPKSAHKSDGDDTDNEHEDVDHTEGIYFHPVVELPDKVEVKTGEEDETILYCHRAKLFRFDGDNKEWKERGVGDVKILKHKTTGKIRLLMRREPIMKLCLNHYLTPDLEFKTKDPKSWIWFAHDFSDEEQVLENFCIRFKTPEIAKEFKRNIDAAKNGSSVSDDNDDVVFVSETPAVSEELKNKALALKLPENFYKYLDLPDCPGCRGCKEDISQQMIKLTMPKFDDALKPSLFGQSGESGTKPVIFGIKSPFGTTDSTKVDSTISSTEKPLFAIGTTNTNASSESTEAPKSQISSFSFALPPSSTNPAFSFTPDSFVFGGTPSVTVQNVPVANIFGGQTTSSPLFGQNTNELKTNIFGGEGGGTSFFGSSPSLFGAKASETSATPIFGNTKTNVSFGNKSDVSQSTTSIFGPSSDPISKDDSSKSQGVSANQSGTQSKTTDNSSTHVFGSKSNVSSWGTISSSENAKKDVKEESSLFTQSKTTDNSSAPVFGSKSNVSTWGTVSRSENAKKDGKEEPPLFSKHDDITFGSIAAVATSNNVFAGDNSNFKWEGAGSKLFSKTKTTEPEPKEEEADANESQDNADDHDPYFEPVVPLPNKIELKTGEEDEDIVFSERAKLYRHDPDTKEWKERGVGNLKLLKHRERGTYRLLLRREQVHKVVCNHLVTPELKLSPMSQSEVSYCWPAMNMSQDETEPSLEFLCAKFKNKDLASQFKNAIEIAQKTST